MPRPAAEQLGLKPAPYGPLLAAAVVLFAVAALLFMVAQVLRAAGKSQIGRWTGVLAEVLFFAGSAVIGGLWVYRWRHVGHLPLQNMFEIFLSMGLLIYPLSLFCRAFLGARLAFVDCLIGIVLAVPAGWVNVSSFSVVPKTLPPALNTWLFGPHVAVYMVSYVILFMAAAAAIVVTGVQVARGGLWLVRQPAPEPTWSTALEQATYRLTLFGFPLLTMGLVLGSVWGKLAWGDFWFWDAKEMWSLVSWVAYLLYLHVRYMLPPRWRSASAPLSIVAAGAIVITLLTSILSALSGASLHSYAS